MHFLHFRHQILYMALHLLSTISDCATVNSFNDVQHNSIERDNKDFNKLNYDVKDKCEIKIITSGVCSVNSQLVKPQIKVIHPSKDKYGSFSKKQIINEDRMRNMVQFDLGEKKANNLVDEFLMHFKSDFSKKIDPLFLPDMGVFKFDEWGSAKIYELSLNGISNIKRRDSIALHTNSKMKTWSINTNFTINNITADFKVDAKLKSRVFVKGWHLQVLIEKCILNAVLLFEETTKMLTISSLTVKYIEGFRLQTENLSWPFNEVVKQILDKQKEQFKSIITNSAQKYMSETLKSIDVTRIFDKMKLKE